MSRRRRSWGSPGAGLIERRLDEARIRIEASDREPCDGATLVLLRRGRPTAVAVPLERLPAVLRAVEGVGR